MRKVSFKEWQRYKCGKLGHDWAYQDCDKYMTKICLRCGAEQVFFPEEVENNADLDDDNSKKD